MRLNTPSQNLQNAAADSLSARETTERRDRAYSDLPGLRHETKDVLQQLQAHIAHLEDLGGRLSFTLNEVRSLIRR